MVDYAFAFDPNFSNLFWSQKPTNLGQAFLVAERVEKFLTAAQRSQELLVTLEEHNDGNLASYHVSRDEQDDDDS
jgi:hypothetical protein